MPPSESCEQCGDTGWAIGADGRAETCGCHDDGNSPAAYKASGIPSRFETCTFDNYHPVSKETEAALVACRQLVSEWPPEGGRGLLLCGNVGIGKTHMAAATCRALIAGGVASMFMSWPQLLGELRREMDAPDHAKTGDWARLMAAEALVLDEIGGERVTAWTADRLGELIGHRYNWELPMIITSNLVGAPLRDWMGDRMSSRLAQVSEAHVLYGPDYRRGSR